MSKVVRRLALVACLLLTAAALSYLSPKLGLYLLLGIAAGMAISWIVGVVAALRRTASVSTLLLVAVSQLRLSPQAALAGGGVALALVVVAIVVPFVALRGGGARPPVPAIPPSFVLEVPMAYVGHATFRSANDTWAVRDQIDLDSTEVREAAAAIVKRDPVGHVRGVDLMTRYMARHGWAEQQVGSSLRYIHRVELQKTKLAPWWRVMKTVRIHLRTQIPIRGVLLVAGGNSSVALDTPGRMVRRTFPSTTKTENTLENRELVTVGLESEDDSPVSAVRVETRNAFGRNRFVAWGLGVALRKVTGWTDWALGALGGVLWIRRKRILEWWRRRHAHREPRGPKPSRSGHAGLTRGGPGT